MKTTFWSDFKKFIAKGNIIDMSVGVVIGGAFGKITSSLVNDVIMPLISLVVGGLDVTEWKLVLKEAVLDAEGAVEAAEVAVRYGNFIQMILDFLIIAFSIFVVLRIMLRAKNKMNEEANKKAAEEKAAAEKAAAEAKAQADADAAAAAQKIADERAEELALLREIRDSLKK